MASVTDDAAGMEAQQPGEQTQTTAETEQERADRQLREALEDVRALLVDPRCAELIGRWPNNYPTGMSSTDPAIREPDPFDPCFPDGCFEPDPGGPYEPGFGGGGGYEPGFGGEGGGGGGYDDWYYYDDFYYARICTPTRDGRRDRRPPARAGPARRRAGPPGISG